MSGHTEGKRRIEKIAWEVADELGLTSVQFEWRGEEKHLRFPLRITTAQGVTQPVIRFTMYELEDACNSINPAYQEVRHRLTIALQPFCPRPS